MLAGMCPQSFNHGRRRRERRLPEGEVVIGPSAAHAAARFSKSLNLIVDAQIGRNLDGSEVGFVAWGAGIRPGVRVPKMSQVDVAPTAAALLGLRLPDADGATVVGILGLPGARR